MNQNQEMHYGIEELPTVADYILNQLNGCRIIAFEGDLGAGKTTLTRALLRKLGISGIITSPTFSYVNIYKNDSGKTIYHFDLYRISSLEEFKRAGFDEYLEDPESIVIIEWPEVIRTLLNTLPVCFYRLEHAENERIIKKTK